MIRITGRRMPAALAAVVLSIAAQAAHGQQCRVLDAGLTEYSGNECRNGLAHGHGYATGESSYLGDFLEGRRHGNGEAVFRNGVRYDGQWERGRWNGRGKLSFPDGSFYEGDFKEGVKHGRGTYHWPSGTVYEGEWKDNARLNGVETTASGRTTTYASGAIVTVPAAPSAEERVQAAQHACTTQADSCETACAVGALTSALLSKGKSDGNKENAECAARCQAAKTTCLAGGTSGGAVHGRASQPGVGRQFCDTGTRRAWCMHDRLADAAPYRELKKACSFYFAYYDPQHGHRLAIVTDTDEQVLRKYIDEVPAPGSPNHAYFRDRAEVAKCLLESGRGKFHKIVHGEYFHAAKNTPAAMLFPRSIWEEVVRHNRELAAKNHSTVWFDYGNAEEPVNAFRQAYGKCNSHNALGSPFYPVAWWETNLKSLEALAQRGTESRQGESQIVSVLRAYRCHQSLGWPYAAENQFWVRYQYEGRTR